MKILGRDIRPRTAFNRWGEAVKKGMFAAERGYPIPPEGGNADKAFYWLGKQPGIGKVLSYGFENPAIGGGALIAGTLVNNLMGNPIGGAIDFISMDLTNLKPDAYVAEPPQVVTIADQPTVQSTTISSTPNAVIASQPGVQNQVEIPQLTEEEKAKFLKYTTNRTAQQILTYQALQDYLNQQPGMENY